MDLTLPVTRLPGIGESSASRLKKLRIHSIFDLLYHLPFRYEDRSRIVAASSAQAGETVTLIGRLDTVKNAYTRHGKILQKSVFSDASGSLQVIWFNQPFLSRTIRKSSPVALYGKVDFFDRKPALISPEYELINEGNVGSKLIHTARLIPVYPETAGVSSKWLRSKIFRLLSFLDIPEILPFDPGMLKWKEALWSAHFPASYSDVPPARNRLAFDELLLLQLLALLRRDSWRRTPLTHKFRVNNNLLDRFITYLPYTLTSAQLNVVDEIISDLSRPFPANRLLEGDVGSGKTVVAAFAAFIASQNGFRTLFMAPTQILAHQHHQTLVSLFRPFDLKIGLITGSKKIDNRHTSLDIIVGTHALISKSVKLDRVGLVVIDEQHRFGVAQRAALALKGASPHILTMTATPIPRTVALTLYGDLDLSVIDELPPGRIPVKTWVVPDFKRPASYSWIASQLASGQSQLFVVCPFIEESETLTSVRAATVEFDRLKLVFPEFPTGLLHGRLKSGEKEKVMEKFRAGEYRILVTTPVVEVGLDIPAANIMLVEAADRFGLAQLHQLRGRVGRGDIQSYCLLFTDKPTNRLKAMEQYNSGLKLAELDLKLRGPGELYGTAQHGLPDLKVADYGDLELIKKSRNCAQDLLPRLGEYPLLRSLLKEDKIALIQPN